MDFFFFFFLFLFRCTDENGSGVSDSNRCTQCDIGYESNKKGGCVEQSSSGNVLGVAVGVGCGMAVMSWLY